MIYNANKHENKMKWPIKSHFTVYYLYSKGEVILKGVTVDKLRKYLLDNTSFITVSSDMFAVEEYINRKTKFMLESVIDEDAFKAYRQQYTEESNKIRRQFIDELREEYGCGLPKKAFEICYQEAYEEGHSSGYHEVELRLDDRVDFAWEIIKSMKEEE